MADVTDLLARLVAIDSVNPAFGGPGEAGVAAAVERYFHEVGLETFRQPVQPGRENVVSVRTAPASRDAVVRPITVTVGISALRRA